MFIDNKLKELRLLKGIPQRKIAAMLDIDTATYSKIENGILKPKMEYIEILSKIFDCDPKELRLYLIAERIYNYIVDEENALDALEIVIKLLKKE